MVQAVFCAQDRAVGVDVSVDEGDVLWQPVSVTAKIIQNIMPNTRVLRLGSIVSVLLVFVLCCGNFMPYERKIKETIIL